MICGRWSIQRGSGSRGYRSYGRGPIDEPIASPRDEHALTLPLGDKVEEPHVDATDEASSSW